MSIFADRAYQQELDDLLSESALAMQGAGYFLDWVNDPESTPPSTHPANTKIYARFISSTTKYTVIQADQIYTNSPSVVLRVYRDFTGGTIGDSITIRPARVGSSGVEFVPPEALFDRISGMTITGDFTASTPVFNASQGGTGGGESGDTFIRILPPSSTFLVELDNRSNSPAYTQFQLRFSEVPREFLPEVGL